MSPSVRFLVDGFNLYHAVREVRHRSGADCRWLDIRSLCTEKLYLIDRTARVDEIHYFSALAHHLEKSRPGTVARHERYLSALRATHVATHLGIFKPKDIHYHSATCDVHLRRHEEKETDVAIAAAIVEAAAAGACSALVLVSGDTDLVPALSTARHIRRQMRLFCLFPPYRSNRAFRAHVDGDFKISPAQLPRHRLPDPIVSADGRTIAKPAGWWRPVDPAQYAPATTAVRPVRDPFALRLNAYRVLLTRGRDCCAIYVPPMRELGETTCRLQECGVRVL